MSALCLECTAIGREKPSGETLRLEGMKSYRKELWFEVPSRRAFLNITRDVETCLRESGVQEGLALVNGCTSRRRSLLTMSERAASGL